MPIRCEIVSQDRIVYQGDADIVVLPGVEGVMGILPHHAPVLTVLQFGVITVRSKNEELFFTVAGGVAEVQPDQVTILADAAENIEEIDLERAQHARERAEEALERELTMDPDRYKSAKAALLRSNLRIASVQKYRRSRSGHHTH